MNSPLNDEYNYGLGYISSVLKKNNYNVYYIALRNGKDIIKLYAKISLEHPEIIGFSATTSQISYLKDIAKQIKHISNTFIICGGIHPTLKPECILDFPDLDAIVRGEGEFPMLDLANAFKNKEDYREIDNFWFRKDGEIIKNNLRPLIKNLDDLPFPDKSSLNYQRVIDNDIGMNRFIFSRGCPFDCPYCSNRALANLYKASGSYVRLLSPQKAIEKIELDAIKYKFNSIFFDDDIISFNKKWFYEFFDLYKRHFKYPFGCNIRPGIIDLDMVKLLKEAGVTAVNIGVEHGNENFRKTVLKRAMSNKQIIDTFKLFDEYNISCRAQLMVGLPFENKNMFLDTVALCRKLPLISRFISIFYPYPGTELGRLCEEKKWMPREKYYFEREQALIDYPNFTKEEIQMCHDIFPFLIDHKCIPLSIPLEWTMGLFQFYKLINSTRIGRRLFAIVQLFLDRITGWTR